MDADALFNGEEFVYADCIALDQSTLVGYRVAGDRLEISRDVPIDESDLTGVFQNFSVEIDGATYAGGEVAAHGSGGFFYKKVGAHIDWAVMSLEAGPFVGVERCNDEVRFLTDTGSRWVVKSDDLTSITIQRGKSTWAE